MAEHYFVTGTDTGVGKTLVTAALLVCCTREGGNALGLKPLAAGCEESEAGLRNADALLLQSLSVPTPAYARVNPFPLRAAVAPHIAAGLERRSLSVAALARSCRAELDAAPGPVFLEGAGGWRVPLNDSESLADLPRELRLPVILVVALRLGCLNHARLSAEAIRSDGLQLAAWVANSPGEEMPHWQENLQMLHTLLQAPCLGRIPPLNPPDPQKAAPYLHPEVLIP